MRVDELAHRFLEANQHTFRFCNSLAAPLHGQVINIDTVWFTFMHISLSAITC